MSELIAHVYGRVSVSHNKSTRAMRHTRNNDFIFEKVEVIRYRGCLLIPQLATEQPSQYYRYVRISNFESFFVEHTFTFKNIEF